MKKERESYTALDVQVVEITMENGYTTSGPTTSYTIEKASVNKSL